MKMGRRKILSHMVEPHMLFQIAALLIASLFWIGVFYFVHYEQQAAEKLAIQKTHELADVYESRMVRNLGYIDQTLKVVKFAYEHHGGATVLDELDRKEMLPPRLIFEVSIINQQGRLLASTATKTQLAFDPEKFFRVRPHGDDAGPAINIITLRTGERKMLISRRLNDKVGRVKGAVLVSVAPDFFTSDYEKNEYGSEGLLGVVGEEGTYLAKRIGDRVTSGDKAFGDARVGHDPEATQTPLPTPIFSDGIGRFAVAKRLYGYPLTIVVGLSKKEQMAPSQVRKTKYLGLAAIISLVFGSFAVVVSRLLLQLNQARQRSRRNQETYYAALESSKDAIFVLRATYDQLDDVADFTMEDLNQRAASVLGLDRPSAIGKPASQHLRMSADNDVMDVLHQVFRTGIPHEAEWPVGIPALGVEWFNVEVVPVEDGIVLVLRDITDRKRTEAQIRHMAHHDPLTGLPNRSLLHDRLGQALLRAQREKRAVTVAFIDLDNFKPINDALGHRVGDVLLKTVAARMVQSVRKTDSIIRFGGDEFVVILEDPGHHRETLEVVLKRLGDGINQPVYFEGNKLVVTSSVGLSRYPEDGDDPGELLQKADTAMYQVKTSGRNHFQYYVEGMQMQMQGNRLDDRHDLIDSAPREKTSSGD